MLVATAVLPAACRSRILLFYLRGPQLFHSSPSVRPFVPAYVPACSSGKKLPKAKQSYTAGVWCASVRIILAYQKFVCALYTRSFYFVLILKVNDVVYLIFFVLRNYTYIEQNVITNMQSSFSTVIIYYRGISSYKS